MSTVEPEVNYRFICDDPKSPRRPRIGDWIVVIGDEYDHEFLQCKIPGLHNVSNKLIFRREEVK